MKIGSGHVQRSDQRHGGGIAAAAAQRRDVVGQFRPWKRTDLDHTVARQLTLDTLGVQALMPPWSRRGLC